jgi:hypothetical protein
VEVPSWQTSHVTGIVFPEEVTQGCYRDAWLFVVEARKNQKKTWSYFARADRAGRVDLASRIPELAPLSTKVIAVFGLGGIGAPSVMHFAQAMTGELRLVDHDRADPATAVRWPLGFPAAGWQKTDALLRHLRQHPPFTHVAVWPHRVGQVRVPEMPPSPSDSEVLGGILEGADLVFDATAEIGIHQILSEAAARRGIPFLYAHTTLGGWGGLVAAVRPGRTEGCWLCLQHALADGTLPLPASDPNGTIQPVGCADPTFTGSGFDVTTVALEAVRTASGIVCAGIQWGYPDADWDVAILSLRDDQGQRIPPCWRTFPLRRHPACPACS